MLGSGVGGRGTGILAERKATTYTTGRPFETGKIQTHSLKEGNKLVSDIWGDESVPVKHSVRMSH